MALVGSSSCLVPSFDDAFPVCLLYAALHPQLMVEVGILIPEMIDACSKDEKRSQRHDIGGEHGAVGLLRWTLIAIDGGHRQVVGGQHIVGNIVCGITVGNREDGDGRPVDVDNVGATIDKTIVKQRNGNNAQQRP